MQDQNYITHVPYRHNGDKRQDPDGILPDLPEKGKSQSGQECPGQLFCQGELFAQSQSDHAGKYHQDHSRNDCHAVQPLRDQQREADGGKQQEQIENCLPIGILPSHRHCADKQPCTGRLQQRQQNRVGKAQLFRQYQKQRIADSFCQCIRIVAAKPHAAQQIVSILEQQPVIIALICQDHIRNPQSSEDAENGHHQQEEGQISGKIFFG